MGIRTGEQVLAGLRDGRVLYIDGERVGDVTTDPRLAGGARTIAALYDLQHRADLKQEMTYPSPSTGEPVGLSFIQPKTRDELRRRRVMIKHWHDHTLGMFGRAPDFLNVMLASFAAAAEEFGGAFAGNFRAYYERVREGDLASTHSLTNPQADRSSNPTAQARDLAVKVVRETDAGIVVHGARMLATLAAYSDELLVMPAPSYPLPERDESKPFALGFGVPIATPGLRLISRPTVAQVAAGSPLDHPLSSFFDEGDCMVVFDNVVVPWERVFIHRDVEIYNTIYRRTGAAAAMQHQYCTKDLAKAEFMMALAFAMVRATKIDEYQHIQNMLVELINHVEMVRSCLIAAEEEAVMTRHGILHPATGPLDVVRFLFPQQFRRACEIIQILGAGGLVMVPSLAELSGPVGADVATYNQAAGADAAIRIKLFRLAFDASMSSFSGRQQLYERFFAGDPVRVAEMVYRRYDKDPHIDRIQALLRRFEADAATLP